MRRVLINQELNVLRGRPCFSGGGTFRHSFEALLDPFDLSVGNGPGIPVKRILLWPND